MWRSLGGALGLLLCCASAQAAPRTVCCFKITVSVEGGASLAYSRDEPSDDKGDYVYSWLGSAYGIAHLRSGVLVTDRGIAAGYLEELDSVARSDGARRNDGDPKCLDHEITYTGTSLGQGFGQARFVKADVNSPAVGLGKLGYVRFSDRLDGFELHCGSMATDALDLLQEDNERWFSPREFFGFHHIQGPSARQLAKRKVQDIVCVEAANPAKQGNRKATGRWNLTIKIVPFPADDLKRQQRRLSSNLGKEQPDNLPADQVSTQIPGPPNGCHER